MTYTTYYLCFKSKTEGLKKLKEVNYLHEELIDGETRTYYSVKDQVGDIDIVGEIYKNNGVYDENTGEVIAPPTKIRGWHVNLILSNGLPEELQEFVVEPNAPQRVFN